MIPSITNPNKHCTHRNDTNAKGGDGMLYSRIQKEHARLEEQMLELQRKLEKLPEGKLICCKDGKGYRWYQVMDIRRYIFTKSNAIWRKSLP